MGSKTLVIAVDPGTGSSSPTGFSVFDPLTLELLYASNIDTSRGPLHHRIKDISDLFQATIEHIDKENPASQILVCIEQFVMVGKGGESLQRLIGSFMGRLPYRFNLLHVQNTKVKLYTAGHGHADKSEVARGLLDFFQENSESCDLIKKLISRNEADILDSIAIGVTGWRMLHDPVSPKQKPRKKVKKPPTKAP